MIEESFIVLLSTVSPELPPPKWTISKFDSPNKQFVCITCKFPYDLFLDS